MQDRPNLETLPYDILSSVFKSLDRPSLASACLSSRRINEVASENLYTSILFVISQDDSEAEGPLSAIKRRPSLKRVVQAILFKFKTGYWGAKLGRKMVIISDHIRSLPRVRKLEWLSDPRRDSSDTAPIEYFMDILSGMPSVEELVLPTIYLAPLVPESPFPGTLRHLTLHNTFPLFSVTKWYGSIIPALESLIILTHVRQIGLLRGANALRVLKVETVWSIVDFVEILDEFTLLECLGMKILMKSLENTSSNWLHPIALPKLRCLELRLDHDRAWLTTDVLENFKLFAQSLISASNSLEVLRLSAQNSMINHQHGESLSKFILKRHGTSLRVLDLVALTLREDHFCSILYNCPHLEEFGFFWKVPELRLQHSFWGFLGLCPTLTTLRLTTAQMQDSTITALIRQGPFLVKRFLLRTTKPLKYAIWESRSYYDSEVRRAQEMMVSRRISAEEWNTETWG
ncbi:hypothetical protein FRC18_004822 [Serendipita sp. 400]|nr:hypothetical protein FRC18_004822 [Serendipita sp. 400]